MPSWLKISLRIVIGTLLLIVLLWLGIAAYVQVNKKWVLEEITEQLNENINGSLTIESMEPELIRGFPGISIDLENVLLRDSLWHTHRHDLLKAKNIFVSVNAFSIIRGKPRIREISIENGSIYLFRDSTGYSNTSIFKRKEDRTKEEKQGQPRINNFNFKNVNFAFENDTKFKLFQLAISRASGGFTYTPAGWEAEANVNALIKNFAFNIRSGSFLKNKTLSANVKFSYDKLTEILTVPAQDFRLDNDVLDIGMKFILKEKPTKFTVNIRSDAILYKNAISLVSPNISRNLKYIDLKEPLALEANIMGRMKFRDTPRVNLRWTVTDNVFLTPRGDITECSFSGRYTNEVNPVMGHNDRNSRIDVYGMRGKYTDIPFRADTLHVTNLVKPILEGRFRSTFALSKLGPVVGEETFSFQAGTADMNLIYKGALNPDDTTVPFINGYVQIKDAAITYVPRGLPFTNSSITLQFAGSDLFVKNTRLQSGTSTLYMNGSLLNFLNLYYTDPEKIVLDWNIRSPQINLNEFRSFLKRRRSTTVSRPRSTGRFTSISHRVDRVLEASTVHMILHVDKAIYRKFHAKNINADVTLAQSGISLKNVTISHADGRLLLSGNIDQEGNINRMDIDAKIENVHVNDFFRAFENFGQQTITSDNIKGRLFAYAKVSGNIKDDGDFMSRSLQGTVSFNLKDGALVNFEPLMKVGKFIFRKRKLENITFSDLKNTLDVKGDKIYIRPMLIESSALNAKVEGTYAIGPGTDITLDIPLRNPKKDELIMDDSLKAERQMKGLVLHLRAVDGEDGKVVIKWNRKENEALEAVEKKEKAEKKEARRNKRLLKRNK